MTTANHPCALFETAIGTFGIAWTDQGIAWVQLPEANALDTRARMLRRFSRTGTQASERVPPPWVQATIDGIVGLVAGQAVDLTGVALDMHGVPDFHRRVYEVARTIPPGSTLSYGQVAARLGDPSEARAVGQALGRNPFAIVVPCHRVVAAGGKPGGFSAGGGVATKLRLLAIEGAHLHPAATTHQLSFELNPGETG